MNFIDNIILYIAANYPRSKRSEVIRNWGIVNLMIAIFNSITLELWIVKSAVMISSLVIIAVLIRLLSTGGWWWTDDEDGDY